MGVKMLYRDFGSAFWERVQLFICLAFPVVPLVLCYNAELQVVQNVLPCSVYILSSYYLLLFSVCALSHPVFYVHLFYSPE